jgi:hypothetical protein
MHRIPIHVGGRDCRDSFRATLTAFAQEAAAPDSAAADTAPATPSPLTTLQPRRHSRHRCGGCNTRRRGKTGGRLRRAQHDASVEDPCVRCRASLPHRRSDSSKPLLETPRTVSFVSEEHLAVRCFVGGRSDACRAGTTPPRATDCRAASTCACRRTCTTRHEAPQHAGHVRTVLSAWMASKWSRARRRPSSHGQDRRLHQPHAKSSAPRPHLSTGATGFYQLAVAPTTHGRPARVGGPVSIGNKQAASTAFILLEDSDTYVKQVAGSSASVRSR